MWEWTDYNRTMSLRASTSIHQSLAVDTEAELGKLTTTSLEDGDLVYVKGTGQYWRLSKSSTATVSGNVRACASGGRWFLCFIDSAGGAFSVANVTALAAIDSVNMVDGAQIYVESVRSIFTLSSTAGTPDGITIVAAYGSTKYWYRSEERALSWSSQTTWYINASTGSDENDGSTSLTALASWAEFRRRVDYLAVSMTVYIASDLAEVITGTFSSKLPTNILTIEGVPTILATSTSVTTFVNPTGNNRGTVSAGGVDFSLYVGKIVRAVGTSNLLPITSNSGAVGRGGFWASGFLNTKPVDGSVVEVLSLPAVTTVRIFTAGVPTQVKYLQLSSTSTNGYAVIDTGSINYGGTTIPHWVGCHFADNVVGNIPVTLFSGCLFTKATQLNFITTAAMNFFGGGSTSNISNAGYANGLYFSGFLVEAGSATCTFLGGCQASDSATAPLGIFTTNATALSLSGSGTVFASGGATYGTSSGAGGAGVTITNGARLSIASGTPTITGATNDFTVDGATSLVGPPTAGGVWAAALDLSGAAGTGWAKWVAGGRKFINYATGSTVSN